MMAASLRPQQPNPQSQATTTMSMSMAMSQAASSQSPTSSTSSVTTTPTSPHFAQITRAHTTSVGRNAINGNGNSTTNINGNGNGNGGGGGGVYGHPYAQPGSAQSNQHPHHRPGSSASVINHPKPPSPPLYHPPPRQTFSAYLRTWSDNEITQFLNVYSCGHHAPAFQRNDIDGKCLLDLDQNTLKEMGVTRVGERLKIYNGIKELRKRVAASMGSSSRTGSGSGPTMGMGMGMGMGMSRVELRLNGAATPPLDDVPTSSPGLDELYTRSNHPASSLRRLGSARPPPLDLHSQQPRNIIPHGHVHHGGAVSSSDVKTITPRPPMSKDASSSSLPTRNGSGSASSIATNTGGSLLPGSHSLPASQTGGSHNSSITVGSSSVPAPAPARPTNLSLRAPPIRDPGRRSPSPVNANADATGFVDRPLPPQPGINSSQSSAAEYASAVRYHAEGRATPTWSNEPSSYGSSSQRPTAPSSERRNQPPPTIVRNDLAHRKNPSLGSAPSTKQPSPVKHKFGTGSANGRANTSNGPVHPFAANRAIREDERRAGTSPPDLHVPGGLNSSSSGSSGMPGKNYRNANYVVGTGGNMVSRSASITTTPTHASSTISRRADAPASGTLSLEDLRKQLVKFINSEDGTTRTVNVSSCTSGVEVLERVLKKFGKWGTGATVSTDTESDEDGDRLEVDGWGVYEETEPDDDCKPLSEAALLSICVLHRGGTVVRESGLTLRRTRKPHYRKNMEVFLGEAPPIPMSPTSPTYIAGPRYDLLTPSKPGSAGNKNMNRASIVSVMSGLGVPMTEPPPSPTATTRSPSSGSFLTKSKKMYNFFGHRPPSELISNHLAEYFPSAKKRELEKTVRHSMLRMSIGPNATTKRSSTATSDRIAFDASPNVSGDSKRQSLVEKRQSMEKSPPSRRPMSRTNTFTASPPADTIPEETEYLDNLPPRVNISMEGSPLRNPRSSGESDRASLVSVDSRPPLLPPFEPAKETLTESLQAFSPTETRPQFPHQPSSMSGSARPRPKSIVLNRRGSAGSSRSRMSMLSQLRKNRDRSDTASMLTVDEITAEVEHRRASTITFDESDEEEAETTPVNVAPAQIDQGIAPTSGLEDEEEYSEDDESSADDEEDEESEEEEEEEVEVDDDGDQGKAFMSTGSKRIIKWIKGALIGAGSFGSVFLGMDSHSGLLMAVKQVELGVKMRSEERTKGMIAALEREVELLKVLQHENIVQYLDSSTDGNYLNIFLEYVPGGSVAALLNKYGAFEEALVKRFVRQILHGLEYLHKGGIVHRDIKGANILVDNKGGIKISDFGISKKVESNLLDPQSKGNAHHRQSLQGSVFWMAPEVVKQTGHSSKADIWSVGCLVVEMLTGAHPWPELNQLQAMFQIGKLSAPVFPNDISAEAANFLHKTFEINDEARPTASELLQHPFLADDGSNPISAAAAQATMNTAMAARSSPSMQSLSALAEAR